MGREGGAGAEAGVCRYLSAAGENRAERNGARLCRARRWDRRPSGEHAGASGPAAPGRALPLPSSARARDSGSPRVRSPPPAPPIIGKDLGLFFINTPEMRSFRILGSNKTNTQNNEHTDSAAVRPRPERDCGACRKASPLLGLRGQTTVSRPGQASL